MHCQLKKILSVNKWTLFNQLCLLCQAPAKRRLPLCSDCEWELPWLPRGCAICALPFDGALCNDCLLRPPAFTAVEAALAYAFPVDTLIRRFKHQARWPMGKLLARLLTHHLTHRYSDGQQRPALLIPVPLSRRRQRRRGFNQAQMLANWLGKALGIAVDTGVLVRVRDGAAQQQLDFEARQHNLHGAYALAQCGALRGLHVALVDDVMTSGATARVLAALLREGGAARVDVYCLARTPKG